MDLKHVFARLRERNPDATLDELGNAFVEQTRANPKLSDAAFKYYFDIMDPIARKVAAGEKLTKEERRFWKSLGGKHQSRRCAISRL